MSKSRIGVKSLPLPQGVSYEISGSLITVKGPKGTLQHTLHELVQVQENEGVLHCEARDNSKKADALTGTTRAILGNMVHGVSQGFEKRLKLSGVGYRAQVQGNKLNLTLGLSHPVYHQLPDEVSAELPTQTEIVLKSANKQVLGQTAAEIRGYRPPEPYKGKGIRYDNERIAMKEAKKK